MYRAKGQFLRRRILNEGTVIGGTKFKVSHSGARGELGPSWLDKGKLVQFRALRPWSSARVSGLRFQVSRFNMGEPSRGYAGCRGSPRGLPREPLLWGESH